MSRDPDDLSVGEWISMMVFFTVILGGTVLFFWTAAKYLVLFAYSWMGWGVAPGGRIVAIALAAVLFLVVIGGGFLLQLREESDPNRNWP